MGDDRPAYEELAEALAHAQKEIARLKWLAIYRPTGRCRTCGGKENDHRMWCKYYVGPLTHKMNYRGINGTFGGANYDCLCGGWFRQGGIAGHGDGTRDTEPVCPNADQDWRGPRSGDEPYTDPHPTNRIQKEQP